MFFQLIAPALCAACNFYGGLGFGYQLDGFGASINWVDRHTLVGKIDDDTLMVAASWQALHMGRLSAGPYVGRTFTLDGRGPKAITLVGLQIQVEF
jgi:hypothetical protein